MNHKHITETCNWLARNSFAKKWDENQDFDTNSLLYFRPTKSRNYMVINHFNRNLNVEFQGFDLWLCDYARNDEPGRGTPINMKSIKLGLKLPEDHTLIEELSQNE